MGSKRLTSSGKDVCNIHLLAAGERAVCWLTSVKSSYGSWERLEQPYWRQGENLKRLKRTVASVKPVQSIRQAIYKVGRSVSRAVSRFWGLACMHSIRQEIDWSVVSR